jgi:hypothetical protein
MVLFSQEPYTTELINEAIPNLPHLIIIVFGRKIILQIALGANKNMLVI